MRQIQITLKNEQIGLIQKVLEIINVDLNIKNMTLLKGDSDSLIIIRQNRTFVPELIERLKEIGVATELGIIDVLPLEATIPELTKRFDDSAEFFGLMSTTGTALKDSTCDITDIVE